MDGKTGNQIDWGEVEDLRMVESLSISIPHIRKRPNSRQRSAIAASAGRTSQTSPVVAKGVMGNLLHISLEKDIVVFNSR